MKLTARYVSVGELDDLYFLFANEHPAADES